MIKITFSKKLLAAAIFFGTLTSTQATAQNVTVYYPNWATYGLNYQPSDLPAKYIDEIVYAFAQVGNCAQPYATDSSPTLCNASDPNSGYFKGGQDYKLYSTDPYADFNKVPPDYYHPANWDGGKGIIGQVLNLGKPVILSIGGWSLSVPLFEAMKPDYREGFVASIKRFFEQVKNDTGGKTFAGVDLDWEPNENSWSFVNGTNGQQQLEYYLQLLRDIKAALPDGQNKIGIAAPASPAVIKMVNTVYPGFWQKISQEVDSFNVMSYDYHGIWDADKKTNFNAPLYYDPKQPEDAIGRETFNAQSTINTYLEMGVAADKMNLGVPAYGRVYGNVEQSDGLYQSFNGTAPTPIGNGTLNYNEIMSNVGGFNWSITQDWAAGQAHAYDANKKAFVTFDNPASIANKVAFVNSKSLKGLMMWDVSGDFKKDAPGFETNSLVKAMKGDEAG